MISIVLVVASEISVIPPPYFFFLFLFELFLSSHFHLPPVPWHQKCFRSEAATRERASSRKQNVLGFGVVIDRRRGWRRRRSNRRDRRTRIAIVFFGGARKIERIRRKESSPPRRHLRRDFIHDTRAVPHVHFLRVRQNRVLCRTGRAYVGTRLEIDRREHRGTNRTSAKERRDMFSRRVDFDDRVRIDVL